MAAIKTQTVPALDRGLSILELLAKSRAGLTLPELVEQSGLPRSSVHYLLVTLERRGYVQRNERTSRYLFGVNLVSLANSAWNGLSLRQQAAPFLSSLARRTQMTAHMAILKDGEAVIVAKHSPIDGIRMATWVGKRMEVHCTGLGKALIAYLSGSQLECILREHGLPRHNENTISSPKKLREELVRVVQHGFSLDDEEDELGLRCIGAPLFDPGGGTVAAVSLSGTSSQFNEANYAFLIRETQNTGAEIGQVLAQSPPDAGGLVAQAARVTRQAS
jgi:DNA-binding IclR family transcriptional regulator